MNAPSKVAIGSVLGFVLGGAVVGSLVYLGCGHHRKTYSEDTLTLNGIKVVHWNGCEYDGIGFMEPDGSSLTASTEDGPPIVIYKSKRIFQEGYPEVDGLKVEGGRLVWADGVFSYELMMREVAKGGGGKP